MPNLSVNIIQAKLALRELVDTFSILADRKAAREQTELFTEDAKLVTYLNGMVVADLTGRKAIGDTFEAFLANFETVYHFNGQHLVQVDGESATGQLYCLTTLYGNEGGKTIVTSAGVRYSDDYLFVKDRWLIAKRTAFFEWQRKEAVGP